MIETKYATQKRQHEDVDGKSLKLRSKLSAGWHMKWFIIISFYYIQINILN